MDSIDKDELSSGPSSLSSDQASLCVISDPDDLFEEDDFVYIDKHSLASSVTSTISARSVIVFHSEVMDSRAEQNVLCHFIRPKDWNETPKDFIGLFKMGWASIEECVSKVAAPPISDDANVVECVTFNAESLPMDHSSFYQFCYHRDSVLVGASTPFQLKPARQLENPMNQSEKKSNASSTGNSSGIVELHSSDLYQSFPGEESSVDSSKDYTEKVGDGCEKESESKSAMFKTLVRGSAGKSHLCLDYPKHLPCQEGAPQLHSTCSIGSSSELNRGDPPCNASDCTENFQSRPNLCGSMHKSYMLSDPLCNAYQNPMCSNFDHQASMMRQFVNGGEEHTYHRQSTQVEIMWLKDKWDEATKEKMIFQEKYLRASMNLKESANNLCAERAKFSSLKAHTSDLMMNFQMVCAELNRIHYEKNNSKIANEEQSSVESKSDHDTEYQLRDALAKNAFLEEELDHLREQMKKSEENRLSSDCECDDTRKKLEELKVCLSAKDLIQASLQAEFEEELKLAEDRDRRLTQLMQTMLAKMRDTSRFTSSVRETPLQKMEQNVCSTLEALEYAMKEIEILRSRKAALNRENRDLREDYSKEKEEWELKIQHQDDEYKRSIGMLHEQLKGESSAKAVLEREIEEHWKKNHQLLLQRISELECTDSSSHSSEMEANTRCALEALEEARKEIDSLREQKANLIKECSMLQKQLAEKVESYHEVAQSEEHNCELTGKLQEACNEYCKLYLEKRRLNDKFDRLQQKIRAKVISRLRQPVASSHSNSTQPCPSLNTSTNTENNESANCRSAAWRALVDELM